MENQDGSYLLEETLSNQSLKKRKYQKLEKETTAEDFGQEEDLNILESSIWPEEEDRKLLTIILDMCKSNKKQSYRVTLNKLDFNKVASLMENIYRTKENCKEHLQLLISKTKKVKTMHQVISEKLENAKSPKKKMSSYEMYCEDNQDIIRSMARESKTNIMVIKSKLWKDLPEIDKLFYKTKVDEQRALRLLRKKKTDLLQDLTKSPFLVFKDKQLKKYPSLPYHNIRKKYAAMDLSKQLKYIKKSFKTLYLEEEEFKKYAESNADQPTSKKRCNHYPSRKEIKYYYHQYLNLPEKPPQCLALFAMKESGINNITIASNKFYKLDQGLQKEWKIKFKKAWIEYNELLTEWMGSQDARDVDLMKRWPYLICDKMPGETIIKPKIKKEQKPKRERKVYKEVVMPVTVKKFENEPEFTNFDIMAVFDEFLRKNGIELEKPDLQRKFEKLSEKEKEAILESASRRRSKYIRRVTKFVDGLTEDMKKLYLGLKRMKLISYLKEDIFEEIYPDEQYPVYVKQPTNFKIKRSGENNVVKEKGKRNLPLENEILDIKAEPISLPKSKRDKVIENVASIKEENLSDGPLESPIKLKKRKTSLSGNDLMVPPKKSIKKENSSI